MKCPIPEFTDNDRRGTPFHNFDLQPEVIGVLQDIEEGAHGEQYKISTNDGMVLVGTLGVIASKINKDDLGKFIKIVFKGNKVSSSTKRTYKDFDVFVKSHTEEGQNPETLTFIFQCLW